MSEPLGYDLSVSLPLSKPLKTSTIFRACEMKVGDGVLTVDLIPLTVNYFDVILGMDWLSANQATIDCEQKIVKFKSAEQDEIKFQGTGVVAPPYLVLAIQAGKLLK